MSASSRSAAVGTARVDSRVVWPPSVSLPPHTISADSPPSDCGVRRMVPTSGSSRPSAATYAGKVLSGPLVSRLASRARAVSDGTASTTSASAAAIAIDPRADDSRGASPASRATAAAPTAPIHARLSPLPGHTAIVSAWSKTTTMPTATKAVPNPSAEITSSVTPAAQRWVSGAKSASTATGADNSGTHQVATPGRNSCHPAMSGVGMPAARRPRPVGSAATCGPAHGTPGSANRANTSPVRT